MTSSTARAEPSTESEPMHSGRRAIELAASIGPVLPLWHVQGPRERDKIKSPRIANGLHGASRDPEQIATWWGQWPDALIGVVTGPSGLVVLDLDRHGDNDGFASLAAAGIEIEPTLHYTSVSGSGEHHVFGAPDGVALTGRSDIGGMLGVDVRGGDSYVVWNGPVPTNLPALPVAPDWLVDLARKPETSTPRVPFVGGVEAWLAALPEQPEDEVATRIVDKLVNVEFGHDAMKTAVGKLVAIGAEGGNVRASIARLVAEYTRPPTYDTDAWRDDARKLLEWTIQQQGAPLADHWQSRRRPTPASADLEPTDDFEVDERIGELTDPARQLEPVDDLEGFWRERPVLEHIEQAARARLTSPWAVLGAILVYALAGVPPTVTLPPIVGGRASLNTFCAFVGSSGIGKGAAMAVASDVLGARDTIPRRPIGSGEGMAAAIGHTELVEPADGGKKYRATIIDEPSVIFEATEVDALGALGARLGSTLTSQLRSAWSGEQLGFTNRDQTRNLSIGAHEYRLGFIVGVQPRRSGALLNESDGGLPQRFVWLRADDPHAREGVDWPGILDLPRIDWPLGMQLVTLPVRVAREVKRNRIRTLQGKAGVLDGHAMLARLKVSAALAVLEGRTGVDETDWRLAGLVMEHSDQTRAACQQALRDLETEAAERRGTDRAHADHAQETTKAKLSTVDRIANNIAAHLDDGNTWTRGELNRKQAGRDRQFVDEALAILVRTGRATKLSPTEYRTAT